ncbi:MAG TPA: hypothetical protein VL361_06935 [Candidatus Limnocylindrales bacterium]|nr:hypothetical protein [Candidatus Limnocylindrales bacterium]
MHKPPPIAQVERRLAELGCSERDRQRHVRELAEHHEDLRTAGLEEGLSDTAAESRANQLLGEPVALAEQLAAVLRQSSWWGRHRIIGFCLLPPLGIFAGSVLSLFAVLLVLRLCFSASEWRVLADQGAGFRLIVVGVQFANYAATAGMTLLFCWLARRASAGLRWAMLACAVCSLQSYFGYCRVAPHAVSIGYSLSPDWICALIPLLIAGVIWARNRHNPQQILESSGAEGRLGQVRPEILFTNGQSIQLRDGGLPTYSILAIIGSALTLAILFFWFESNRDWKQLKLRSQLQARVWQKERNEVERTVKKRQAQVDTPDAKPVSLLAHLTATLADDGGIPSNIMPNQDSKGANNLAELPEGLGTFGGVLFIVQGKIQLMGKGFLQSERVFPSRAKGIRLGQTCKRLHLLHGASFVSSGPPKPRETIAALVLHYADGSSKQIDIISGEHVLDWWGPLMSTGINPLDRLTSAPGTELAWTGTNPLLARLRPGWSLRLYKSTFDNPQPQLSLTSIDYVSKLTEAAPFLVGLTIE